MTTGRGLRPSPTYYYPTPGSRKPRNSTTDFPTRRQSPPFGKRFRLRQECERPPKSPDMYRYGTRPQGEKAISSPTILAALGGYAGEASICWRRLSPRSNRRAGGLVLFHPARLLMQRPYSDRRDIFIVVAENAESSTSPPKRRDSITFEPNRAKRPINKRMWAI